MSRRQVTSDSAASTSQHERSAGQSSEAAPVDVRPVRVDETGRLFEMSGEPIVVPGLTPEDILQGIEDERAGRLRSLDDYLASRDHHNGI